MKKYYCEQCGREKKSNTGTLCRSCSNKKTGEKLKNISLSERHKVDCACTFCEAKRNTLNISKEILEKLYIIEGKSFDICARELDCSIGTIHSFIHKYKIPVKKRSEYGGPWNKGLDKNDPRVIAKAAKSSVTLKAKFASGQIEPWNKGLTKTTDSRVAAGVKKLSEIRKTIFKGSNNPFYGKKHKAETITKLSLAKGGTGVAGELSDYGLDFTTELKKKIRNRDTFCQVCGKTEQENGRKLDVHHIDYNKKNCSEDNLMTLCHSCHVATNSNRKYWCKYFKPMVDFYN